MVKDKETNILSIGENRFSHGWKLICRTWNSPNRHCLEFGSSRESLARWVNKTCGLNYQPYFYRIILNEAVERGYAIKKKSSSGYSIFTINNVSTFDLIEKHMNYFEFGVKDKYFIGMFRGVKYSYVRINLPVDEMSNNNRCFLKFNIYCYGCLVDDFIAARTMIHPMILNDSQYNIDLRFKHEAENAITAFIDSH